jgi:hypothetical protein
MDDALFRNHLNNTTSDGHRFGEIAAATYHLAVLKPDEFGATYIAWADSIRTVLGGYHAEGNPHVISDGTVVGQLHLRQIHMTDRGTSLYFH